MSTSRIKYLAAVLGLAAVFGSVACDDDQVRAPETETITSAFAAGGSCSDLRGRGAGGHLVRVEVVRGNVPCPAAKRALRRHYNGGDNVRWNCVGPGYRLVECEKSPGMAIRGRLYCRDWGPDQAYCLDTFGDGYASGGRQAVDGEAGVRFTLAGRVLTVRLLASAPSKTRWRVSHARIRATCGKGLASLRPESELRDTRTRFWPAGRVRMIYRFRLDLSGIATWCRLEDPEVGHVAFVRLVA
jgi:hypothetical protein